MASLRVPQEHKERLLNLSSEEMQKVVSALEAVPITSTLRKTLTERLATVDAIPESHVNETTETLIALYIALAYSNETPSEVANDIAEALEGIGIELKFPDQTRQRLTQLLSSNPLVVSAKAVGLMYEYENVFSTARIFTDIRPIFGLDPEELPKAGVITHMLSIHYFHSGDHKEINIALDELDIDVLMDALERANNKGESLKSILEMAQLTYIES